MPKRFGHVVVRTRVERLHLFRRVGPAGKHDDRCFGPAAQPLNHLDAVQVRQAEIEERDIGRMAAAARSAAVPVAAVCTSN